jgi:uncharacterized protein YdaU (DUF1376 family)
MVKYPWMPLFWGDFLANTMHLSAQEAGAYLFLIAHAWEHDGRIPGEPVRLARIAHVRADQWKKVWRALENFFEIARDGPSISRPTDGLATGFEHPRVMIELHRLGKISNNRKGAARQMHSRSHANAEQVHGTNPASASTSTSISNRDSSSNGKSMQPRARQDDASLELQLAAKQHLGISPDEGMDYRSPPAKKSDNVLMPIPEKERSEPPAQKPATEKEQSS